MKVDAVTTLLYLFHIVHLIYILLISLLYHSFTFFSLLHALISFLYHHQEKPTKCRSLTRHISLALSLYLLAETIRRRQVAIFSSSKASSVVSMSHVWIMSTMTTSTALSNFSFHGGKKSQKKGHLLIAMGIFNLSWKRDVFLPK
ncbi:hypothetical protein V8E54_001118 [Elaphomyces granulatus]